MCGQAKGQMAPAAQAGPARDRGGERRGGLRERLQQGMRCESIKPFYSKSDDIQAVVHGSTCASGT